MDQKYRTEGYNVINIAKPKITVQYLKERFSEMVANHPLLLPPTPLYPEVEETGQDEPTSTVPLINKEEIQGSLGLSFSPKLSLLHKYFHSDDDEKGRDWIAKSVVPTSL